MKEVIANDWTRVVRRIKWPKPSPWGRCDDELKRITICSKKNKSQSQLLDTIGHEEIHAVYPEFNEREVLSLTDSLVNSLNVEQKIRYLDLYGYEYIDHSQFTNNPLIDGTSLDK